MPGDDRRFRRVELIQQRSIRLLEPEHYSSIVRGVDAGEKRSHRGPRPGVKLEEDLLERELDVCGCEGLPVVPLDAVTEAESIQRPALLDLPALGQLWDRVAALVPPDQSVADD